VVALYRLIQFVVLVLNLIPQFSFNDIFSFHLVNSHASLSIIVFTLAFATVPGPAALTACQILVLLSMSRLDYCNLLFVSIYT